MTHSERSTQSPSGAALRSEIRQSSRKHGVTQALATRELEILTAARAGSTTAFDELQSIYSPRLSRIILRITKNQADAEDALQDAFLRAYVALRYFEARSTVYSWLTRIAINSALTILRRRRARPEKFAIPIESQDGSRPLELEDTAPDPEELSDLRQRSDQLLRAIQTLQPRLRIPIELQLAGEHSVKEIAGLLNISLAAAKARLYRARAQLAKRISVRSEAKHHFFIWSDS